MNEPPAQPATNSNLNQNPIDRTSQQVWLILILLAFYCLPHFLIFLVSIYSIATESCSCVDKGSFLNIIKEVATRPGAYTNNIHQMIMPVVAAITAANAPNLKVQKLQQWLFVFPLLTIFVVLLNALIFSTSANVDETQKGLISQLFIGISGNLAVYVMLLVGLKIGEQK